MINVNETEDRGFAIMDTSMNELPQKSPHQLSDHVEKFGEPGNRFIWIEWKTPCNYDNEKSI